MVASEQPASGDDVDPGAEQSSELIDQVDLIEQGSPGLELDQEIDVARWR